MNYQLNNAQKMNEIIFANRNKAYGAFEIRSSYGATVAKSLASMFISIGTLLGIGFYFSHRNDKPALEESTLIIHDSVFIIPYNQKTEDPLPEEAAAASSTTKSDSKTSNTSTIISDSLYFAETTETLTSTGSTQVTELAMPGSGNGTSTLATLTSSATGGITKKTPKNGFEVDEMPKFKGGLSALNDFIRNNVHYPPEALELGEQGTAYARFVVDENGKVIDIELQNRIAPSLKAEALRVLNLIPDFESPGKAKGEPVKTYYQLPINFKLK